MWSIIFFYIHLFGIYSTRLKYILSCQTTFSRAYSPEEILKICQHHRLHLKDVHCPWKFENLWNKEMGKMWFLWFPFFLFSNTKLNCKRSTGILIERAKNVFLFSSLLWSLKSNQYNWLHKSFQHFFLTWL